MHCSTDSFNAYITLKGGHQYYAHLTFEKTEAQISHLPKVTQRECARARIKIKQCGSKVQPMLFMLPKTLPICSQLCLQDCLQDSTFFMELSPPTYPIFTPSAHQSVLRCYSPILCSNHLLTCLSLPLKLRAGILFI